MAKETGELPLLKGEPAMLVIAPLAGVDWSENTDMRRTARGVGDIARCWPLASTFKALRATPICKGKFASAVRLPLPSSRH